MTAEALWQSGAPLWIVALAVIVPLLMTFSKQAQKLPGFLGWLSRSWHTRQLREVERSESLDQAIEAAVRRRVAEEVTPVMDRLKKLEDRLTTAEREIALRDEYITLATRNNAKAVQFLAAHGLELPPPPMPPFYEWIEDRLKKE